MSEGGKGRAWNSNRANFDRNLAVVIGIDRYENLSIRNLNTAVSDASAIADLLEQEYAYKQSDEKPEVIRLFDEAATLQGLRDLFTQTLPEQKLTEGDRLIVYFAGHGLPRSNEDGPEGYLVPHDADPTEPTSFLAMREVSDALSKLECHHLLVILDCCFAGTFCWAGSRKAVPILETIRREHYYHFIRHPAWQVITSSAHDQEALDVARLKEDNRQPVSGLNQPHSPFALALLEGLHPGNDPQRVKADLYPDGVVTAHELFVYLQSRVKELSGEQQAPGIYPLRRDYDKGEFIFTPPGFDPQKLAEALPLNEENNPYRGLKSFDEKHARFFFGRQALIEELAARLAKPEQALTVVLGVSGSGKSSLVKAGLIPQLRSQQTEQNTEQWRILDPMRPGVLPFTSLARTLLPIVNDSLLEQLAQVSFLDGIFQPMLQAKAASEKDSEHVALMKIADFWCSATPEAKLLLIEDYFAQLGMLGNPQQQKQLKSLHDRILAEVDAVSHHLQQDPQSFSRAIAAWSQKHPGIQLVLVIDQFEELLTRSQDDRESPNQTEQQDGVHGVSLKENRPTELKEWQKFLEVLRIAIKDHAQTLRVVLTLRSDFEPRFLSSALERYWKDARFPVRAMTSDELRQAIENPALKQALYFEELKDAKGNTTGNLVSNLVDEVGQMPGALPLLSFTLSELYARLYKRWQDDPKYTGRTLLFADYKNLGGVAGALTGRATEEYNNLVKDFGEALGKAHQSTMRRVMLRMVAIEGGGVARRQVPESELEYLNQEENNYKTEVINRFVKARLLVKGQEAGEAYVEPAHDILVRGWDLLQSWREQEQENVALQRLLTPVSKEWSKNQKAIGFLWDDNPRILLLKDILNSTNNWLNQTETKFVKQSLKRRKNNRLRLISSVLIVIAGLTGLSLEANRQRNEAIQQRNIAIARQLVTQARTLENQQSSLLQRSMLLAVESLNYHSSDDAKQLLRDGLNLLPRSLWKDSYKNHISQIVSSPNGKYLATSDIDQVVQVRDLKTSQLISSVKYPQPIKKLVFSKAGESLAIISGSDVSFFNSSKLQQKYGSFTHGEIIEEIVFDPKNGLIITKSSSHVKIWDVSKHRPVEPFEEEKKGNESTDVLNTWRTFGVDAGNNVAIPMSAKTLNIWDRHGNSISLNKANEANLKKISENSPRRDNGLETFFSPNGRYMAFSRDSRVRTSSFRVFDLEKKDGKPIHSVDELPNPDLIKFSPDGKYLAWQNYGMTPVQILNLESGIFTLWSKDASVESIEFSPDSKYLLVITQNQSSKLAHMIDIENKQEAMRSVSFDFDGISLGENSFGSVFFDSSGKYLIAVDNLHKVLQSWLTDDMRDTQELKEDDNSINKIRGFAFSPSGHSLATTSTGTERYSYITLWNIATSGVPKKMSPTKMSNDINYPPQVRFNLDERMVVIGDNEHNESMTINDNQKLEGVEDKYERIKKCKNIALDGVGGEIKTSTDLNYLAFEKTDASQISILNRQTCDLSKPIENVMPRDSFRFSPSGRFSAIVSEELVEENEPRTKITQIRLKENSSEIEFKPIHLLEGTCSSSTEKCLIFSNQENYLVYQGLKTTQVWDITSGKLLKSIPVSFSEKEEANRKVLFSNNDHYLVTNTSNSLVEVWESPFISNQPKLKLPMDNITKITISPDGKILAIGASNGTVAIVDLDSGQKVEGKHDQSISSLAFNHDGSYLASGGADNTVKVWSTKEKIEVSKQSGYGGRIELLSFNPQGNLLAVNVASQPKSVFLWNWQLDNAVDETCKRLTRNLTLEEWQQYLGSDPYRKTCPNLP